MKKLESCWGDSADTQRVSDQEARVSAQVRIHGAQKSSLETGRRRLLLGAGLFTVGLFVLSMRLVEVALFNEVRTPVAVNEAAEFNDGPARADIVDRNGVVSEDRKDKVNKYKAEFALDTKKKTLSNAMNGADVFIGVARGDLVTQEMVKSMAVNPIIFALSNPDPEISPADAFACREAWLTNLSMLHFAHSAINPAPIKSLMRAVGLPAGPMRKPLCSLDTDALRKGLDICRDLGLDQRYGYKLDTAQAVAAEEAVQPAQQRGPSQGKSTARAPVGEEDAAPDEVVRPTAGHLLHSRDDIICERRRAKLGDELVIVHRAHHRPRIDVLRRLHVAHGVSGRPERARCGQAVRRTPSSAVSPPSPSA